MAQKFELAIDLEYEDPDLSIVPDLGGEKRQDESVEEFAFDARVLDSLFTSLKPAKDDGAAAGESNPYGMAVDYLTKGLLERASAEISRAMARGGDRGEGLALLGDVFNPAGLFGERSALPRGRARTASPTRAIVRRYSCAPRARTCRQARVSPGAVAVMRRWKGCACRVGGCGHEAILPGRSSTWTGPPSRPARPDVLQRRRCCAAVGDVEGAIVAYRDSTT